MRDEPFGGVIGRYFDESTPSWPEPMRAPSGAPNVVIVVLDDVGFAQLGCFGSDIATPTFDRLAAEGLRYSNFHTTALCSPTRSCVLTGRNHHSNGMGRVIEIAAGYPGYNSRIPFANGFLSEMLVEAGYAAYAIGKWHLTPEDECHAGASRARWPLGRGFERFYGFMSGETHQFVPNLIDDNHPVSPPYGPEEGYHLTTDLVDRAIGNVRDLRATDPDKPFFVYLATGACHSPHQSPAEWIARYRGAFDDGWDKWREATARRQIELGVLPEGTELSARPDWVPAWTSLSADERRLYARFMEAFAGFLSHTDHEIGRFVEYLRHTGDLDNTLLFVLSDNGASSEGGPTGSLNDVRPWNGVTTTLEEALAHIDEIGGPRWHNNYPWGWTVAGNTPFRRWKREVHEGGVADPLIVHWPRGGAVGGAGFRRQYVHAIDIVPTVLEAVGIEPPEEIRGVDPTPDRGDELLRLHRRPCLPGHPPHAVLRDVRLPGPLPRGLESRDVPPDHADRTGHRRRRVGALPRRRGPVGVPRPGAAGTGAPGADGRALVGRGRPVPGAAPRPSSAAGPRDRAASERAAPTALRLLPGRGTGARARGRQREEPHPSRGGRRHDSRRRRARACSSAQGSLLGGWCFYVAGGALHYVHNRAATEPDHLRGEVRLDPGPHTLAFEYAKVGEHRGRARLLADGTCRGRRDHRVLHPRAVLGHRRRPHLRLQQRPPGDRRDHAAFPLQRDASTRSSSRSTASPSSIPEEEVDAIIAMQ